MKKIWIVFLALAIIAFVQTESFAQTEIQIRDQAIIRLRQIITGQIYFYEPNGHNFYPTPSGCPNNVCWQGQTLSSLNTPGSSNQDLINVLGVLDPDYCPQDLSVNTGGNGDVRFRCRRQGPEGRNTHCFAYRCEQASPAGCRQIWRLRFDRIPDNTVTPLKCFDVQNTGVCAGAPSTIIYWNSSCL